MGLLKPLIPIDALPFCIKGWGGQRCTWARSAACGRRWFTPPFFTRPPLTPFNEPWGSHDHLGRDHLDHQPWWLQRCWQHIACLCSNSIQFYQILSVYLSPHLTHWHCSQFSPFTPYPLVPKTSPWSMPCYIRGSYSSDYCCRHCSPTSLLQHNSCISDIPWQSFCKYKEPQLDTTQWLNVVAPAWAPKSFRLGGMSQGASLNTDMLTVTTDSKDSLSSSSSDKWLVPPGFQSKKPTLMRLYWNLIVYDMTEQMNRIRINLIRNSHSHSH